MGALGALLVHVGVIALFILVSFEVPQPDEEAGGVPVVMGNVEAAQGWDDPSLVDVDVLEEVQPVAEAAPELPSEQDLLTQAEEETVVIKPKTEKPKEKPLKPKETVKPKKEAKPKEPVKKPEKTEAEKAARGPRWKVTKEPRLQVLVRKATRRGIPRQAPRTVRAVMVHLIWADARWEREHDCRFRYITCRKRGEWLLKSR